MFSSNISGLQPVQLGLFSVASNKMELSGAKEISISLRYSVILLGLSPGLKLGLVILTRTLVVFLVDFRSLVSSAFTLIQLERKS